jgi:hypothetical protein
MFSAILVSHLLAIRTEVLCKGRINYQFFAD